ncbi:MAG: type II secretion system F family protein [Methylobacter sp.]|nr:type II secretion system F family protein [Methylobacter sp.]MDP2100720.1 type II secretion system F family protein [Methylobacter sp.]MDP2427814.1 type II secretion system F family protein [Methylobacter sp.]MDP3363846.1 type II secretion system F family protein [Methylobacter sp.]
MDFLMQLLTGLLSTSQWSLVLTLSAAVFIFTLALLLLADDLFNPVRSRFKREITSNAISLVDSNGLSEKLRKHNSLFTPSDKSLLQRTATRLHYGGFHGRNSLLHYYATRMLLMVSLPLLALMATSFIPGIKSMVIVQALLVSIAIGYMAPSFILDKLISTRQKTIRRAFPDALDLLVVCSEAGLSLDAAIQKVTSELSISQPILADELDIVIAETRAGIDRHKALQKLVERTGVDDIKGLVAALSQSMRFGTSIVETLKVYSEELRDKRTQAAEAVAAKIGTKLIFPLAMCLLPAFLIVVMAPAIIIFKNM